MYDQQFGSPPQQPPPEPIGMEERSISRSLSIALWVVGGFYALGTLGIVGMGLLTVVSGLARSGRMGGEQGIGLCCTFIMIGIELALFGAMASFLLRGASAFGQLASSSDGDMQGIHLRNGLSQMRNFC